MGTWLDDKMRPIFKCQCERLLRIMRLDSKEVHVLPRRFPKDPIQKSATVRQVPGYADEIGYYDKDEVERWFWDKQSCEQARVVALELIDGDGRRAVRSGFYSGYSQLE